MRTNPMTAFTAAGAAVIMCLAGSAAASAAEPSELDLIEAVAPQVIAAVPSGPASSAVDLGTDARTGVSVDLGGGDIVAIDLPFSETADGGEFLANGSAVSFDNGNATTTVPVLQNADGVSIQTIIDSASAPTAFDYELDLPEGATLLDTGDGIAILDADGGWLAGIGAPWAKDANGTDVPTHYEVQGTTIVQIVDHAAAGVTYPVVADPYLGKNLISSSWWTGSGNGRAAHFGLTPQMFTAWRAGQAYTAGWAEAKSRMGSELNKETYRQQFKCHADNTPIAWAAGSGANNFWDLEVFRGTNSDFGNVAKHKCNW